MNKVLTVLLVIAALFSGCARVDRTPVVVNPEDVVKTAIEALNSGDIEKCLGMFTDDFVLIQDPPGVKIEGKAQYEAALRENAKWHQKHSVTSQYTVDGDKVTFTAKISSDEFRILGIDDINTSYEYRVRDGKIISIMATPDSRDWAKIVEISSGGIGVSIKFTDKGALVEKLAENSPASDAGVKLGDVIMAVDGVSYLQMREGELPLRIRGKVGSKVRLTMVREGSVEPIDIEVTRVDMAKLRWQ
jgi:hypothetical protein